LTVTVASGWFSVIEPDATPVAVVGADVDWSPSVKPI